MAFAPIRGPLSYANRHVHAAAGDYASVEDAVIVVNKASGAATQVTLPAPAGNAASAVFVVDGKGDAHTNPITVVGPNSGTINGASSYVMDEDYAAALFVHNGTEWNVAATFKNAQQPFAAASASGAVTLKSGIVYVTKAGVAALTIADPTATTDDGKVLTVISTTANAHTLSNAAGSGFNGGGAGSDVGTFGGAKGDGITLTAYQGVWYVVSKTNVTLA